jgi:RimJ/RimL family protein N-acetyltransferase
LAERQETEIAIRSWAEGDLWLEERLMGDPAMTEYLGGPESLEKIRERHERYCKMTGSDTGEMFVILVRPDGAAAGSVGYWEMEWQGERTWEAGWSVLPEFQGRGLATRAIMLMADRVRAVGKYRYLHAFPKVDNGASNAVCRKTGFSLQGEADFEYPRGNPIRCNDWRLDLLGDNEEITSA